MMFNSDLSFHFLTFETHVQAIAEKLYIE